MRLWASMNYNPPEDVSSNLLPILFESLFCWDMDVTDVLPSGADISGLREVSDRCTGDAEMSMCIAMNILKERISLGSRTLSITSGIRAAKSNPTWTTVSEDWTAFYGEASKNDSLMQILRWMSYFHNVLTSAVGRLPEIPPDRPLSYVEDISDAIPEELGPLASENDITRLTFIYKLIDGSMMGTPLPVMEESTKGPVFILVDQSNSMSFLEQRVKGLSLAMYRSIVSLGRECYIIPFSVSASDASHWYVGGDPARYCSVFMGGGTSGFKALQDVIAVIRDLEMRHSTVIMITDGSFRATPRTRREVKSSLDESGVKVGFFLVGFNKGADLDTLGPTIQLGNLVNIGSSTVGEIAARVTV